MDTNRIYDFSDENEEQIQEFLNLILPDSTNIKYTYVSIFGSLDGNFGDAMEHAHMLTTNLVSQEFNQFRTWYYDPFADEYEKNPQMIVVKDRIVDLKNISKFSKCLDMAGDISISDQIHNQVIIILYLENIDQNFQFSSSLLSKLKNQVSKYKFKIACILINDKIKSFENWKSKSGFGGIDTAILRINDQSISEIKRFLEKPIEKVLKFNLLEISFSHLAFSYPNDAKTIIVKCYPKNKPGEVTYTKTSRSNYIHIGNLNAEQEYVIQFKIKERIQDSCIFKYCDWSNEVCVKTRSIPKKLDEQSIITKCEELIKKVKEFVIDQRLKDQGLMTINFLLFGKIGAGKSSLISTIFSIFEENFVEFAVSGHSATSVTNHLTKYGITDFLQIWDIFGISIEEDKTNYEDILDEIIEGKVMSINENKNFQKNVPGMLHSQVHVIINVIDSLQTELDITHQSELINRVKEKYKLPVLGFMTKIDLLLDKQFTSDLLYSDYSLIDKIKNKSSKYQYIETGDIIPIMNNIGNNTKDCVTEYNILNGINLALEQAHHYLMSKFVFFKVLFLDKQIEKEITLPENSYTLKEVREILSEQFDVSELVFFRSNKKVVKTENEHSTFFENILTDKQILMIGKNSHQVKGVIGEIRISSKQKKNFILRDILGHENLDYLKLKLNSHYQITQEYLFHDSKDNIITENYRYAVKDILISSDPFMITIDFEPETILNLVFIQDNKEQNTDIKMKKKLYSFLSDIRADEDALRGCIFMRRIGNDFFNIFSQDEGKIRLVEIIKQNDIAINLFVSNLFTN